jgi:ABC-2 type transport system ATP-binding protein
MVDIQNLEFSYPKQAPLFDGLNLKIKAGSITGLLGKNGAGKTSLIKLLTGLLYPVSGGITVMDCRPQQRDPSFLAEIFFVPEEFYFPSISIRGFVSANSRFYTRFDPKLMDHLLREFELDNEKKIHKLSYGQKKKFLISFSLATKSRLLVLDEPTNGLDIPSKAIFRKVMAGTLDEDQLVVVSTHQVKDVENLIDRIIILDDGRVIMEKDTAEISSQLQFSHSTSPDGEMVLYSEMVPGGYKIISPQINGNSSIDIELLFNAVTKGKKIFKS